MSGHSLSASVSTPFAALNGAATEVGVLVKRLWQAHESRRAVRELQDFDARMLKDIGLVPSDIDAALSCSMGEDPSRHLVDVAAGRSRFDRH